MNGRLLAFTAEALSGVPHATGAYFLFRDRNPVCVGMAAGGATLRSELDARLRGDFGPNSATHFAWIATDDPLQAYRLQLAAHALWDLRKTTAGANGAAFARPPCTSSSRCAPGRGRNAARVRSSTLSRPPRRGH